MSEISVAAAKSELRKRLISERNLVHVSPNEESTVGFTRNLSLLCAQQKIQTVACYLSFGSEPDTHSFLVWARTNEIRVLLPISLPDGELEWVLSSGETTRAGMFDFDEATGELADLAEAELIVVPALAVDRRGVRLGKGKGYYDRALGDYRNIPTYALVYDSEVLDEIPAETHDVAVDGFVTETRIIRIAN